MPAAQAYDYIIAGAGCAGLSLAVQLKRSGLAFEKILIIDKEPKTANDRTWCFWTKEPHHWFEACISHRWQQLAFNSRSFKTIFSIEPFQYCLVRGLDFYKYCLDELRQDPRFEIRTEEITSLHSEKDKAVLQTATGAYTASFIFNSAFRRQNIKPQHANFVQHFKGWVVETAEDAFNPACPVFMDFSVEQQNDCRFVYLLPFSKRSALVEYTGFSKQPLNDENYDRELASYLKERLGIQTYTVTETERGKIPMSQSAFVNPYGQRVVNIGTAGGASKASSGYTFYFIQKQCEAIVKQLKANSRPAAPARSSRFSFYDHVLLRVLERKNIPAAEIFTDLFQKNEITSVLAFLNEESTVTEELRILSSLPKKEFILAAIY